VRVIKPAQRFVLIQMRMASCICGLRKKRFDIGYSFHTRFQKTFFAGHKGRSAPAFGGAAKDMRRKLLQFAAPSARVLRAPFFPPPSNVRRFCCVSSVLLAAPAPPCRKTKR
jgi:hypothetical protein